MMQRCTVCMAAISLLLLPAYAVRAEEPPARREVRAASTSKVERERRFLFRAVEELNTSTDQVNSTIRVLESQLDAVDREPAGREKDLRAFQGWYRSYGEWIREHARRFEDDLSRSYSEGKAGLIDRFDEMAEDYRLFGLELQEYVLLIEKIMGRTRQQIDELRQALEYIASTAFQEERNRDGKKKQNGKERTDDRLYALYRDIPDAEIAGMQLTLKALGDRLDHLTVLRELGWMELNWMALKENDCAALSRLAKAVNRDSPARITDASASMIKTYEADIVQLKRKSEELDRLKKGMSRSGSLRALDRQEELARFYETMQRRYEQHSSWLSEQIGAYRADLIEIGKGK